MYLLLYRTLEFQNKQKGLLEEWKDKFGKFERSLKKSEDKLKDQIPAEQEVGSVKRESF